MPRSSELIIGLSDIEIQKVEEGLETVVSAVYVGKSKRNPRLKSH